MQFQIMDVQKYLRPMRSIACIFYDRLKEPRSFRETGPSIVWVTIRDS